MKAEKTSGLLLLEFRYNRGISFGNGSQGRTKRKDKMGNKTKPRKDAYDVWKTIDSHTFEELKPIKVKIAADLTLAVANAIAEETFSPSKDRGNISWHMRCEDGRHFFNKSWEGIFLNVYVSKAGQESFYEECFDEEPPF